MTEPVRRKRSANAPRPTLRAETPGSSTDVDARVLHVELEWLAEALRRRLESYFNPMTSSSPALPGDVLPPPPLPASGSAYADALARHRFDASERLLMALALAPLLRPQLLDVLWSRNDTTQRPFTEFGASVGSSGTSAGGFAPTGETACFLLAGDAIGARLEALQRLSPTGRLMREDLLRLAPPGAGELALAGTLRPSERFVSEAIPGAASQLRSDVSSPAQRVTTGLDWPDLVLPAATLSQLDDIGSWLTHSRTLLDTWGLKRRIAPGFTSLFHGPSGTGKTLSACLLGARCRREVHRVDLSLVVSKYIGETEKNLARLFDTAQSGGWILFFDEADALFGKRTGVADAHDRHANQEVSYLLQRIESFEGVVILASNLRHNIDDAFLRRFQSVVTFALPKAPERLRLWREGFPEAVKLEPTIDLERLAQRHELSGGTIMNVVRYACLRALSRAETLIRAEDLDEGVRRELLKEGRAL